MPIPRLPQNDREITYQMGWKKGVINAKANEVSGDESGVSEVNGDEAPIIAAPIIAAPPQGFERFIWFKAPLLPASLDYIALCALPLVSILAIIALVYLLNQF